MFIWWMSRIMSSAVNSERRGYLKTGLQGTHQQDGLVAQPEAAHTGLQLQLWENTKTTKKNVRINNNKKVGLNDNTNIYTV